MRIDKIIMHPFVKDALLMIIFGALSYLLGLVKFSLPGVEGGVTDLREIPLLISIFYFSNPLFIIGSCLITAMGTPPDGSFSSTFLSHVLPLIASWYIYRYLCREITRTLYMGIAWAIYVMFYYAIFLLPLFVLTNYLSGLNLQKSFVLFYGEMLYSTRFEFVSSALITSLYLVQFKTRNELKKHKENLEELVLERTRQLEVINKNLQQLSATKDKFFSIIAHDLKSPFNSILGFSNLLSSNYESYDKQEQKKFVRILNQSIKDTFKLLENLVLWSRGQKGIIDFIPEQENIYLLVTETAQSVQQMMLDKSIKLIIEIPESLVAHVDKNMFVIIIRNLLSNAAKYTNEKGSISISAKQDQREVTIAIQDTGIGMSAVQQEELFDVTKKTRTMGTNKEQGTGLGLILCREFIDRHGGKIWISSKEWEGTTVYFTIPNQANGIIES